MRYSGVSLSDYHLKPMTSLRRCRDLIVRYITVEPRPIAATPLVKFVGVRSFTAKVIFHSLDVASRISRTW